MSDVPAKHHVPGSRRLELNRLELNLVHNVRGNKRATLRTVIRKFVCNETAVFQRRSRPDINRREQGIARYKNAPGFLRFV